MSSPRRSSACCWRATSSRPSTAWRDAFAAYDAMDAGARTFAAYDAFLGLLDDPEPARAPRGPRARGGATDPVFAEARRLGREVQQGLLALLFEREPLRRLVRQYLIF